jgi:P27 family predicted phage terminase small subunit
MGRRGRAPTPKKVLELTDSRWVKDLRRPAEIEFTVGMPDVPEIVEENPEALDEWNRIAPSLFKIGILSKDNRSALATLCLAWADFQSLRRDIEEEGWTLLGSSGHSIKNPKAILMNEARLAVLRYSQEFGVTPSSRSRVPNPTKADAPDSLSVFNRDKKNA